MNLAKKPLSFPSTFLLKIKVQKKEQIFKRRKGRDIKKRKKYTEDDL